MGVAYVFPGQGSQYVGMGQVLRQRSAAARDTFAEADEALGEAQTARIDAGPEELLTLTAHSQPAILTVSVAAARALREAGGPAPDMAAGHSLGEYSALVVAGALSFPDAVRLVRLRGQAMQEAVPPGAGGMAALVGATPDEAQALCAGSEVELAAANCPGQLVLAGPSAALHAVLIRAEDQGFRTQLLKVSAPFHCAMLRGAGEVLGQALREVQVRSPSIPVFHNIDAAPCADPDGLRERLVRQVSGTVLWESCARAMLAAGATTLLELGPGRTLTGLLKRIDRKLDVRSVDGPGGLDALLGGAL